MRFVVWLVLLSVASFCTGCPSDRCDGEYRSCEVDDQCWPAFLPPGRCLDDHETGRICALYFSGCPTQLRWSDCGGANGKKSSWAGRCVRPEFISGDGGDGGSVD